MSIRVDLHVHSKVSKSIPFDISAVYKTIQRARDVGLNGFALTEHFHSFDFWDAMDQITSRHDYKDGRITFDEMTVLTGAELTVSDAADLILIGPLDALRQLDRQFKPRLSEGNSVSLAEVMGPVRDAGLIFIGAHPTRPGKRLVEVGEGLLGQLDALEINGKDVAHFNAAEQIGEWAGKVKLPMVGSSDAHLWPQVGVQRTIVPLRNLTWQGLAEVLRTHQTQTETRPGVARIVGMCGRHKRLIKAAISSRERQSLHRASVPPRIRAALARAGY